MARTASAASSPDADGRSRRGPIVRALRERPGFLIRRLHQIHLALFATECAGEAVTPVQFSLLTALEEMDAIEQTALGHAIGLDRTKTADVLDRLQQRGLVKRKVSAQDRRRKTVCLTLSGRATVEAPTEIPEPLLAVAAAAAAREGWQDGQASARAAVFAGEIALLPAQDFGVVTPLAFVVGAGASCLKAEDGAGLAPARIAPLNDGPAAVAFRFGGMTPEGKPSGRGSAWCSSTSPSGRI